jgi:heptosyltransferase-1
MKGMDLVISMDSLPLHLAGSLNIPTFGVFGPSSAQKYNPSPSPAFQAACPYNEVFMKRCPKLRTCPTGACLKNLEGDRLYKTFKEGFTQ